MLSGRKERDVSMDAIRVLALLLVIVLHFFLHVGFYNVSFTGRAMMVLSAARTAGMSCIPLFLMLSGWLLGKQTLRRSYYRRLPELLLTYLLASVLCLLYRALVRQETVTVLDGLRRILCYEGAEYSWYIEMYLSLFLLIPFLNLLWQALPTRKTKQLLVLTLSFIALLPAAVNGARLDTPTWFQDARTNGELWQLLPRWWYRLYPLSYYFMGSYLREYGCRLRLRALLPLTLGVLAGTTALYIWRCGGNCLSMTNFNSEFSLFTGIMSWLIFACMIKLPWQKSPRWLAAVLRWISQCTLGAYLLSFCFDDYFYTELIARVPELHDRLKWFPVIVALVFCGSVAASSLLQLPIRLCRPLFRGKQKT